jgi:hypothetical protein
VTPCRARKCTSTVHVLFGYCLQHAVCSVDGCENLKQKKMKKGQKLPQLRSRCARCNTRYRLARGVKAPSDQAGYPKKRKVREIGWTGKWFPDKNGYIIRKFQLSESKTITQRQHRVVMSEHLGRELLSHENVHHINGVRDDNRIENLELWSSSQPPGQRARDKLKWAREIIELYGGDGERL